MIFWIVVGGIVVFLGVAIWFQLFSWLTFIFFIIYLILQIGGYLYLRMEKQLDDQELIHAQKTKHSFDYCWGVANIQLRKMTGGKSLSWEGGFGRRSELRYFQDPKTNLQKPYRSFYALLSSTAQYVAIILDIEAEDIVRFYPTPTTKIMEDPFYGFDPFNQKQTFNQNYMMTNRYNYNSRNKSRGGVRINFDDDFGGQPQRPSANEYAQNVLDK